MTQETDAVEKIWQEFFDSFDSIEGKTLKSRTQALRDLVEKVSQEFFDSIGGKTLKSKTQELRDWLDAEIKRIDHDVWILESVLSGAVGMIADGPTALSGYWGLTSDECAAKRSEDRKKLEGLRKSLGLLRSAQEFKFGHSIEDLEKVFGLKVCLDFNGDRDLPAPVIKSSIEFYDGRLRIDFDISLSKRVLVVRQTVLLPEDPKTATSFQFIFPNLIGIGEQSMGVLQNDLTFRFEHGNVYQILAFERHQTLGRLMSDGRMIEMHAGVKHT